MSASRHPINVAVLDDYQGVAMSIVDWSKVSDRANIAVFKDHLADQNAVAERLAPFDVVCIMRERTPMPAALLRRLPNLKLIASTGSRNASIDLAVAAELVAGVGLEDGDADFDRRFGWGFGGRGGRRGGLGLCGGEGREGECESKCGE